MAAYVVAGLAVIAAAASAYTQYEQGQQAKETSEQNAQLALQTAADNKAIAEKNRAIAEQEAAALEEQGKRAAELKKREIARLLAYQRSQEAVSGFRYEGTSINVAEEAKREGEEDVATIWSNALTAARLTRQKGEAQYMGATYAANNLQTQASYYMEQAENASQAGVFGAGSTLLSGLSKAASGIYTGRTTSSKIKIG